jgi:hypothetical protein
MHDRGHTWHLTPFPGLCRACQLDHRLDRCLAGLPGREYLRHGCTGPGVLGYLCNYHLLVRERHVCDRLMDWSDGWHLQHGSCLPCDLLKGPPSAGSPWKLTAKSVPRFPAEIARMDPFTGPCTISATYPAPSGLFNTLTALPNLPVIVWAFEMAKNRV